MNRIAGVVVIYDPPHSLLGNVLTYLPDVEVLYVFDNSPGRCSSVVGEVRRLENVKYRTLGANVGVAAALNFAAKQALDQGYDYLLTMDQDSQAHDGMIRIMLSSAGNDSAAGLIAPFHIDRNARSSPPERDVECVTTAMTSGSLVRLSAYEKVGGFLEKLFIDCVDIEFCLRLQVAGFSVLRANRAVLSHLLGKMMTRQLFGLTVHATNHNPVRFYYQARNRIYVRRQYAHRFPKFFKIEARWHRGRIVKMLLYEKNRLHKTIMCLRGALAGWRGDFSQIPMQ